MLLLLWDLIINLWCIKRLIFRNTKVFWINSVKVYTTQTVCGLYAVNHSILPITQFLPITEFVMTVPAPTEVPLLINRFSSNSQSLEKEKNDCHLWQGCKGIPLILHVNLLQTQLEWLCPFLWQPVCYTRQTFLVSFKSLKGDFEKSWA